MGFNYRKRDPAVIEQRAANNGDFISFIANEYAVFSPKKGENWVRILPPTWDDAKHYGEDVYVHYGVGPERASVLCNAKMPWHTACPVCEAAARALKAGDEELSKELGATKRVLVWVIDRNEPGKGALLWSMPSSVDAEICKISKDRETGEMYAIDDPYAGYDVYFSKDGEGMKTKYTGFSLARRGSSVKDEIIDYIVNNPLQGALVARDYNEVQDIFEGPAPPPDARRPAADDAPPARRAPPADDAPARRAPPADDTPVRRRAPPADETPREGVQRALNNPSRVEDDEIPFEQRQQPQADPPRAPAGGDGMTEGQRRAAELRARLAKK